MRVLRWLSVGGVFWEPLWRREGGCVCAPYRGGAQPTRSPTPLLPYYLLLFPRSVLASCLVFLMPRSCRCCCCCCRPLSRDHDLLHMQYVILDSSSIHDLDSSSLKTLEGLVALLVDRDPPIEMFLAPVSDPLMVQASFMYFVVVVQTHKLIQRGICFPSLSTAEVAPSSLAG